MSIKLNELVDLLQGTPSGAGYQCFCPAHDDRTRSLHVARGDKAQVVMHCHAGCSYENILKALSERGMNKKNKARLEVLHKTISATYDYVDSHGGFLFQKVRYEPKSFIIRKKNDNGGWTYKGVVSSFAQMPLYRLKDLREGIQKGKLICITEGEKDADALAALGFVATTNFEGAAGWRAEYTLQLQGAAHICLVEDNDDAGRTRSARLIAALLHVTPNIYVCRFPELPEHGDVSDWLASGKTKEDFEARLQALEKVKPEDGVPAPEDEDAQFHAGERRATYRDFVRLFETHLAGRRDIFSERVLTLRQGLWQPARNYLNLVRSEAAIESEEKGIKYQLSLVEPHFQRWEESLQPELLVDVPKWDGTKRIMRFCEALELEPQSGLGVTDFYYFVQDWLVRMWAKLKDPHVQNRIIVLSGGQGIGKDVWVDTLLGGLGQFISDLSVVKNDKDIFLRLHDSMVLKISEFDRTANTDVSLLKHIITANHTKIRAPYAEDAQMRMSRTSFIATCNLHHVLRDPTGARRFICVPIKRISWDYPNDRETQMQVLAEAKHLQENSWDVAGKSDPERRMKLYLDRLTPQPELDIIDLWEDAVQHYLEGLDPIYRQSIETDGLLVAGEHRKFIDEICRLTRKSYNQLRLIFQQNEMLTRTAGKRGIRLSRPAT
jgi:hypothetical protein